MANTKISDTATAGTNEAIATQKIDWRGPARAALSNHAGDFAAYLAALGADTNGAWEHADTPELVGLERWASALAEKDRLLALGVLVLAAEAGFPVAMAAAGDMADGMGFHATEPHADGAPVESQIALVAAWLDDPTDNGLRLVAEGYDRTRQLHAWDEDLRPTEDVAFFWYMEVGQCCCAAAIANGDDAEGDSYYEWPSSMTIARGLVMAARGVRGPGISSADAVSRIFSHTVV